MAPSRRRESKCADEMRIIDVFRSPFLITFDIAVVKGKAVWPAFGVQAK